MNRKKIDMEKAYDIISDAPDSESNAILNFWKGRFVDPMYRRYNLSRVEKNESRAMYFIGTHWIWIWREWQKVSRIF